MNNPSILPKAVIGHIVDLYRIVTFKFNNPYSYTKFRALISLANETNSDILIEAGTYKGLTAKRCAKYFKRVFTIELDDDLFKFSKKFLHRIKNIKVIQGDALEEIPKIIETENLNNMIIFLDGHFSGQGTAKGGLIEPAIEELEILAKYRERINGIIIDDFREFGFKGWPKKSTLISAAENYFESHGFNLRVHLDQVILTRID